MRTLTYKSNWGRWIKKYILFILFFFSHFFRLAGKFFSLILVAIHIFFSHLSHLWPMCMWAFLLKWMILYVQMVNSERHWPLKWNFFCFIPHYIQFSSYFCLNTYFHYTIFNEHGIFLYSTFHVSSASVASISVALALYHLVFNAMLQYFWYLLIILNDSFFVLFYASALHSTQ